MLKLKVNKVIVFQSNKAMNLLDITIKLKQITHHSDRVVLVFLYTTLLSGISNPVTASYLNSNLSTSETNRTNYPLMAYTQSNVFFSGILIRIF